MYILSDSVTELNSPWQVIHVHLYDKNTLILKVFDLAAETGIQFDQDMKLL